MLKRRGRFLSSFRTEGNLSQQIRTSFDGIKKLEILDDRVYFPRVRHATILTPLLSSEPNGIIPVIGVPVWN